MRALIIGGGSIGRRHLRNLRTAGESSLACLKREPDANFEREMGVTVVTSRETALNWQPDAVFVCNPTSLHPDGLELALAARAHVFMEKPFVTTPAELTRAVGLLVQHKKIFFIGYMLRFHHMLRRLKELSDTRPLGRIFAARFEFGSHLPYWHPEEDHRTSYAARKELGGGVLNTISHELDLIQYFFGDPIAVTATKHNFGLLDIGAEEQCEAILTYPDQVVTCHLDYLQKDYSRRVTILCENGKIAWDWTSNKISLLEHKKQAVELAPATPFEVNQLYIDELQFFLRLARGESADNPLDAAHALRNTALLLATHEAADTGRTVRLTAKPSTI